MNIKSSELFIVALDLLLTGKCDFVCGALVAAEYDLRHALNENIVCKAEKMWKQFRPSAIRIDMQNTQPWWPKGDQARIETLKKAIEFAQSKGD